jgi:putative transposase
MNNHYHLFIETPDANLSKVMKFINETYARYFLNKYPEKDGHVFKGRYKRKPVQTDDYSFQLSRYIHLNPVKAGIVAHPHEWQWSSYGAFVGLKQKSHFLEIDWLSQQFSKELVDARKLIRQFTYEDIDCNWEPEKHSIGKTLLGSKDFFKTIMREYKSKLDLYNENSYVSELRCIEMIEPNVILDIIGQLDMDPKLKEKLLIYHLKERTNLDLKNIGMLVGKNPKAVSKYFGRIKDSLSKEMKNFFSERNENLS